MIYITGDYQAGAREGILVRVQDRFARILDENEDHLPDALRPIAHQWWQQQPPAARRALRWYTLLGSMRLNKNLRDAGRSRRALRSRLVRHLDAALIDPPRFPSPVAVWRGEAHHDAVSSHADSHEALEVARRLWPVGTVLERPGYTSWSIAAAAGAMFSTFRRGAAVVLLRTILDHGCYSSRANLISEYDVLLPRGTRWQVTAVGLRTYLVAGRPWRSTRARASRTAVVVDVVRVHAPGT